MMVSHRGIVATGAVALIAAGGVTAQSWAAKPPPPPPSSTSVIQFQQQSYSVGEAGGTAAITIVRNISTTVANVYFATLDGTAVAPGDYTDASQPVSFAVGETAKTVQVPIVNDSLAESNETVNLRLTTSSSPSPTQLGKWKTAKLTIVDNDTGPTLSIDDPAGVVEGNSITFTISIGGNASTSPTSVVATTTALAPGAGHATSGADYTAKSQSFSWAPGDTTTRSFTVQTATDSVDEPTETFSVVLGSIVNGSASDGTGIGTINDNGSGTVPTVTISNNPTVTEGSPLQYTATLSGVSGYNVGVNMETWPGNAADTRYTPASSTITIPAGSTSANFTVPTTDDSVFQGLDKTVWGHITGATHATIPSFICSGTFPDWDCTNLGTDDAWSYGTLQDNELPVVSVDNPTTVEGNDLVFTISLSGATNHVVSGTIGTWAGNVADSRYSAVASAPYSIPAGSTTTTFTIPTSNNILDDGDASVWVQILTVTGATKNAYTNPTDLTDEWGLGTIQDNDGELLVNGGFEDGFDSWTTGHTGDAPDPALSDSNPRTGTNSAYLGSPSSCSGEPSGTTFVHQDVAVPLLGTTTFSFAYYRLAATSGYYGDPQQILIEDTSDNILDTVLSTDVDDPVWRTGTYDLTPYAGQTVRIFVGQYQDAGGCTSSMYADDLSVFNSQ